MHSMITLTIHDKIGSEIRNKKTACIKHSLLSLAILGTDDQLKCQ